MLVSGVSFFVSLFVTWRKYIFVKYVGQLRKFVSLFVCHSTLYRSYRLSNQDEIFTVLFVHLSLVLYSFCWVWVKGQGQGHMKLEITWGVQISGTISRIDT